jgi:hypothetical protein
VTSYGHRAAGLWQIHPPQPGSFDPLTNARQAVAKYRTQGLGAWEAYTRGMHRRFLQRGGRTRLNMTGTNYPSGSAAWGEQQDAAVTAMGPGIQGLRRLQRRRGGLLERLQSEIASLERTFGQVERRQGMEGPEELIRDDGTLDTQAVEQRAAEIQALVDIREQILAKREQVRVIAARVVATYQELVARIGRALRGARGERRTRYQGQLRQAREGLGTAHAALEDAGFDVTDTRLDIQALLREQAGIRGTQPRPLDAREQPAAAAAQAGPSADDIARGVMEQLAQFQAGRAQLFQSFGSNAIRRAGMPGAFMDTSQQAAGMRHFGAVASPGEFGLTTANGLPADVAGSVAGRPIIVQHNTFQAPPPDPHALTRTLLYAAQTEMV